MLTLECQRGEWEVVGGEERTDDVNSIRRPFSNVERREEVKDMQSQRLRETYIDKK